SGLGRSVVVDDEPRAPRHQCPADCRPEPDRSSCHQRYPIPQLHRRALRWERCRRPVDSPARSEYGAWLGQTTPRLRTRKREGSERAKGEAGFGSAARRRTNPLAHAQVSFTRRSLASCGFLGTAEVTDIGRPKRRREEWWRAWLIPELEVAPTLQLAGRPRCGSALFAGGSREQEVSMDRRRFIVESSRAAGGAVVG